MEFLQTLALTVTLASGVSPNFSRLDGGDFIKNQTRYFLETGLEISAEKGLFFLGYSDKTESVKTEGATYTFEPIHDTFSVDAGIRFEGFEFGWSHYCIHPVENWISGSLTVPDKLFGGADTFYVKYKATFNLWK